MQLREIAAISGKPGLYRILKPTRAGVIIETLDEKRQRTVAGATSRVSILSDISMYTTDADGSVSLGDILMKVFEMNQGKMLALSSKSDGADLEGLMNQILPNWDPERVYLSDIKKLVIWYNTLVQHAPDLFKNDEAPAQAEATEEKPSKSKKANAKEGPSAEQAAPIEAVEDAKPKKASAKKKTDEAPAAAEPNAKKAPAKKGKE